MPDQIKGIDLNQLFYEQIVAPILKSHFPDLKYSASLIGWGSDVLGYDDLQSTDHNWGVRFQLFLSDTDYEKEVQPIHEVLDDELPDEFCGYPAAFQLSVNADQPGMGGSARHNINVNTISRYFLQYLGFDPHGEIQVTDWLTFSEHKLLGVTSGKVFHDGLAELEPIRQKLGYYPQDVWLYMLASQWEKIFEEAAFVGRCGYVGDELGSMVIASRQVKNLMRLCFLMERKYAPYSKWFGTAFRHLNCASRLGPILTQVLQAQDWKARQTSLAQAYEIVAGMHNSLGITIPLQEEAAPYFDRPYLVVGDGRYAEELTKAISDDHFKHIKQHLGSANQFVDSDGQLENVELCHRLRALYV